MIRVRLTYTIININFSILLIRDAMKLKKFNTKKWIKLLRSLLKFNESYLDEDLHYGLITAMIIECN